MQLPLNIFAEVVIAAKANLHFEDFKTGGRLSGNIRDGYEARMSAFFHLENQGFVKLEDSRLVLGVLTNAPWLSHGLVFGDKAAWAICDAFPARARKFEADDFGKAQIGLDGENFVVDWIKERLTQEQFVDIDHISLRDDSAGYDISTPTLHTSEKVFLEVKTTTRNSEFFNFFLSRNEWEVSQRLANWYLVLVQKTLGIHSIFGYLDGVSLGSYFPTDNHASFQWTISRGQLTQDDVFQFMPGF